MGSYCSAFINYNFTLICFPFSHFRSPPKAGLECHFIISAWISDADMADKSEGRRSSSGEGVDFLPHCFQASSSSSSTTSSRSSVMWTLRFEASATRTNRGIGEMTKAPKIKIRQRGQKPKKSKKLTIYLNLSFLALFDCSIVLFWLICSIVLSCFVRLFDCSIVSVLGVEFLRISILPMGMGMERRRKWLHCSTPCLAARKWMHSTHEQYS
jgi:hypothetical protein